MNYRELVTGISKVKNSHACMLMTQILRRKIKDRSRALDLLREKRGTSWDLLTDLWSEIDKLEALLQRAENKTKKLSLEGY